MSDPRITEISTSIVDLPLVRPHRFSNHSIDVQSYLLVVLRTDCGVVGVGEGTSPGGPWWSGESVEGQEVMVNRYLAPALIGSRITDLVGGLARIDRVAHGNTFAKSAIEMAWLDALGKMHEVSTATLLAGGLTRDRIPVRWALSGVGGEESAEEAERFAKNGVRAFKFKMGALPPEEDLARVAGLVDRIGIEYDYLGDPNEEWSFRTARWMIPELENVGVRVVEQPVPRDDTAGMVALRSRSYRSVLLADEAVSSPAEALSLTAAGGCDAVSIKPGKTGGLSRAREVAVVAHAGGAGCYGGTALETSIGTSAAAQLFGTLPELAMGCELIGPLLLREDLTVQPLEYVDGELVITPGPGHGIEVDWDQVERFRRR